MRKSLFFTRVAALAAVTLSGLAVASTARAQAAINFIANGSITTADPVENGRLYRDANPSVFTINKPYPGLSGSSSSLYHYDTYSFTNTNAFAEAVFITLSTTSTVNYDVFSEAYLTYFNPTDISVNYRGDAGVSPLAASPSPYSITVPANTTFVVIVNELSPNAGSAGYTLSVSTAVPEPSTWALLGLSVAGTGVVVLRRRRLLA